MLSAEENATIFRRLKAQYATVEKISKIAGVAGASIGVIHGGRVVYLKHFGFKDVAAKQQADGDTMYGIGSCSKSYFALAAAALVEEGKLSWTEPVKKVVPDFDTSSRVVTEQANLIDLTTHQLGLSGDFHLTFQGNGEHLIHSKDFWTYLPKLQPLEPFRACWLYNSHGYSIIGKILERITGRSVSDCLQHYVAKPLGLTRTVSRLDFEQTANLAKPYAALANGTSYELPYRQDFRQHFFEAAAGIYTSLTDVMIYARAVLAAASELPNAAVGPSCESDKFHIHHIPVVNPTSCETSYVLGWIRTRLPGVVGVMSGNSRILPIDQLPKIGLGSNPRTALYHQGATVGYFSSFYLFPETQSAVIVLTNSIANCDAADWIAQAMIQALFDDHHPVDWIGLTEKFTRQCLQYYDDMQAVVQDKRQAGPPKRRLDGYVGDYYDDTGIFFIRIRLHSHDEEKLQLLFQGQEKHANDLRFFYEDTFEWTLTHDEVAKQGRYHKFDQSYFNFHFGSDDGGEVNFLEWRHNANVSGAEKFVKKD